VPSPTSQQPEPGPRVQGEVTVSDLVLAKLAGQAARTTYGVVAMHRSPMRTLARAFRGSLTDGVEVDVDGGQARFALHVVMERGINLAQVTANLQEQVRYQVEHYGGMPVSEVSVSVEDLHE
jgi:uncharacterized alkaline shock family protein YloU